MITKQKFPPPVKVETPEIHLEPKITVEAPKVTLYPEVKVTSEPKVFVQTMPAPQVNVSPVKPCSWVFDIERDRDGAISRVIATPQ